MSDIIVRARPGITDVALVRALLPFVPGGIGHVTSSLREGAPLFDGYLFTRPHEETLVRIRGVLATLHAAGVEPLVFEDEVQITPQSVENRIAAWNESAAEFDRLGEMGHEP